SRRTLAHGRQASTRQMNRSMRQRGPLNHIVACLSRNVARDVAQSPRHDGHKMTLVTVFAALGPFYGLNRQAALRAHFAATQLYGDLMIGKEFKPFPLLCALSLAAALLPGSTAMAQNTVRVGAPLPLTGPLSPEGIKQKEGYNLWAETANAKGGIKVGGKALKVEIVYVDYASNTPRAVQAAERLITDDKVNFLFAPFGSGATKAASNVSEKYGMPTIAATASSAQVYDQGYKYLFGTFTPNDPLTEPLADIVSKRNAAVKRIAILARNDLFPLAIAEEMQKSAKKRNLDVVMFEKYAIGTMDHASAI